MKEQSQTWINQLSELLFESLPADLRVAQADLKKNFSDILSAKLAECGLATREDLDELVRSLRDCQQQLTQLEQRIAELENKP